MVVEGIRDVVWVMGCINSVVGGGAQHLQHHWGDVVGKQHCGGWQTVFATSLGVTWGMGGVVGGGRGCLRCRLSDIIRKKCLSFTGL